MSNAKLEKFMRRTYEKPGARQRKIPIIVADSKADYVRPYVEDPCIIIRWWYHGGASTQNRLQLLRERLPRAINRRNSYILYVWTGTCDLTYKRRGYTYLKSCSEDDNRSVSVLTDLFRELKSFCYQFPNVEVLILEVPPYSLYQYNTREGSLGERVDEQLKQQDKILAKQIDAINIQIRELNNQEGFISPTFRHDVINTRKPSNREAYEAFNYKLMLDGVHPDELLAQVWMRRILIQMYINCY